MTEANRTPAAAPSRTGNRIPSRVRRRPAPNLPPPGVNVLALPLSASEAHPRGVAGVVAESLCAIPPGWSYALDAEAGSDAVACAIHQATLRGDELVVLEQARPGSFPVIALRSAGAPVARVLTLVVVRFARVA